MARNESRIQELRNSITEGKMILKSGRSPTGRKMCEEELCAVDKSIKNAQRKLLKI